MSFQVGDLVHRLHREEYGSNIYFPNVHVFKIVAIDGEEAWIRGGEDHSRYIAEIYYLKRLMLKEDYEKEKEKFNGDIHKIRVQRNT